MNADLELSATSNEVDSNSKYTKSGLEPWRPCQQLNALPVPNSGEPATGAVGDKGLFAPHAIIVPLEAGFPAIWNGGFKVTNGVATVDLLGAAVEGANRLNGLPLRSCNQIARFGWIKAILRGIIAVDINCQAFGNFSDCIPVPIHLFAIEGILITILSGRISKPASSNIDGT